MSRVHVRRFRHPGRLAPCCQLAARTRSPLCAALTAQGTPPGCRRVGAQGWRVRAGRAQCAQGGWGVRGVRLPVAAAGCQRVWWHALGQMQAAWSLQARHRQVYAHSRWWGQELRCRAHAVVRRAGRGDGHPEQHACKHGLQQLGVRRTQSKLDATHGSRAYIQGQCSSALLACHQAQQCGEFKVAPFGASTPLIRCGPGGKRDEHAVTVHPQLIASRTVAPPTSVTLVPTPMIPLYHIRLTHVSPISTHLPTLTPPTTPRLSVNI
jgi:hypothetical protein